MKPFQSQIRLHKWTVDEAQRRLGELMRLADRLRQDLEDLAAEAVREQAAAAQSLEAGMTYGAYAVRVIERREKLNRSIAEVEGQIEQAREALKDAFAELKKFELAAAAAEERARKKRDAREQTALDEVAIGIFRRQGK
ncbi:MAG TPA: flagellar export protein FliJ [Aliidongia sp.]|uniref:flagellar export protein FliJ n=1 Tax=Aliidongia sp. TaxID=1914230 RepID=UPI002DDD4260|nr:flagellar export protein FliJ [Aliidongia sp.]HEV2673398.1 flagellar export protein FliJ [Aliidongia sp.]